MVEDGRVRTQVTAVTGDDAESFRQGNPSICHFERSGIARFAGNSAESRNLLFRFGKLNQSFS
jgi:hypothetical protein